MEVKQAGVQVGSVGDNYYTHNKVNLIVCSSSSSSPPRHLRIVRTGQTNNTAATPQLGRRKRGNHQTSANCCLTTCIPINIANTTTSRTGGRRRERGKYIHTCAAIILHPREQCYYYISPHPALGPNPFRLYLHAPALRPTRDSKQTRSKQRSPNKMTNN